MLYRCQQLLHVTYKKFDLAINFSLNIHIPCRAYGFIPCLQPSAATDGFARIYAAYGGFFIVMSFLIGWALEGESAKPDTGDFVGGAISVVGALVIVFWPRR